MNQKTNQINHRKNNQNVIQCLYHGHQYVIRKYHIRCLSPQLHCCNPHQLYSNSATQKLGLTLRCCKIYAKAKFVVSTEWVVPQSHRTTCIALFYFVFLNNSA